MTLVVHDLGPLLISHDDDLKPPGGKKPSALLAALLIEVNRRVSIESLMYAAWGERPSASPSTLESHVWRLRQVLEPERGSGRAPTVLVNDTGGYRLLLGPDQLDSARFQQLGDDARDLLAAGRAARALERVDTAAALWRGRPYAPMSDEEWAAPTVARWSEMYEQLAERRLDALLALGQAEQALADLEPLLAATPFREHLWAQRMLAQYRVGRGEEALQTFQTARTLLNDEIGIEPSAELQVLQRQILDQDPALELAEPSRETMSAPAAEIHLPARTAPLIGRESELATLTPLVEEHRLVTVVGPGGCGKTRLATEVARAAGASFADGVWFVDLAPIDQAELVSDLVMTTLGITAPVAGPVGDALRAFVRDRRALIVLDNCEHLSEGVAGLVSSWLDGPGDGAILATSREPLTIAGEVLWSLSPLRLPDAADVDGTGDSAETAPAVQLFVSRLLAVDPTIVVDANLLAEIISICAAVDGLPLAIELAAARARTYSLAEILAQVEDDPSNLSRVDGRGPQARSSVRSTIESSYRLLTPPEQELHGMLSVLPGPFTRTVATAILPLAGGASAIDDVLPMLVNRSLLSVSRSTRPGGPTSFRQLATVRAHARRALAETGRTRELLDRSEEWLDTIGAKRPRLGRVEILPWYQALDDDYVTVRSILQRSLLEDGRLATARFATRLTLYWYYRDQLVEGRRYLRRAVELADRLDPFEAAMSHLALASVDAFHGRTDLVRSRIELALADLDRMPESQWPMLGDLLAMISAGAGLGDAALAESAVEQASELARRTGDPDLAILARAQELRAVLPVREAPDPVATAELAEQIYTEAVEVGHLLAAWISCAACCLVAAQLRQPDVGLLWSQRLLTIHQRFGSKRGGPFVEMHAIFTAMSGRPVDAVPLFSASQTNARRAGTVWPRRPISQGLLDKCRQAMTQADFEAAWRSGDGLDLDTILTRVR